MIYKNKHWLRVAALSSAILITGCDNDDDDNNAPVVQTGVFVDAAVANIGYRTATQSGVTDADGNYNFLPGEQVTFFIGDLVFPPVTAKGVVTPVDIALENDANATIDSDISLNIARLLQSLDSDNDPDNGIQVPNFTTAPSASIDLTASPTVFEAAFATEFPAETLVTSSDAKNHLQAEIDELNSGGGSVTEICPTGGTATLVSTLPAALASQVFDLTVTTSNAGSPVALGAMTNITFSGSGALFIDNSDVSNTPYQCPASSSEYLWTDSSNNLIYAASVVNEALNEVNLFDVDGNFLAQYEEETTAPAGFNVTGTITNDGTVTGQWELFVDGTFAHDGSLTSTTNNSFNINPLANAATYEVRVSSTPVDTCTVQNGSGTVSGADIANVAIDCATITTPSGFTVTGSISNNDAVSGQWELLVGGNVVQDGSLASNPNVTFNSSLLSDGVTYEVRVSASPLTACIANNNTGTISGANIDNVEIICTKDTTVRFAISGTVSGVQPSDGFVVLQDSSGAPLAGTSSSAGASTFGFFGVPENSQYQLVFSSDDFNCVGNDSASGTLTTDVTDADLTCTAVNTGPTPAVTIDTGNGFKPVLPVNIPAPIRDIATDIRPQINQIVSDATQAILSRLHNKPANAGETHVLWDRTQLELNQYTLQEFNTDNELIRQITLSRGADGEVQTSDDIPLEYQVIDRSAATQKLGQPSVFVFDNAGADGIWFTRDDWIKDFQSNVYIEERVGNYIFIFGNGISGRSESLEVGDDRLLFSGDDGGTYVIATVDEQNGRGESVSFNSRGSDGIWFTADDNVLQHSVSSVDAVGNDLQTITYLGNGADNTWFTDDDDVSLYTIGILNSDSKLEYLASYASNGEDNDWFTSDDPVTGWGFFAYDTAGNQTLSAFHNSPGVDTVWFTEDDLAAATSRQFNVSGVQTLDVTHTGMGPDDTWFTGDDVISQYVWSAYTDSGLLRFTRVFNSEGDDGVWFTSDDAGFSYNDFSYDDQGRVVSRIAYNNTGLVSNYTITAYVGNDGRAYSVGVFNSGTDGEYLTADDQGVAFFDRFDSAGTLISRLTLSGPGTDATWFTDDDDRSAYRAFRYDSSGNNVGSVSYSAAGNDGVWDTADDEISFYTVISLDTNANITEIADFGGAGADALWETADDQLNSYSLYTYDGGIATVHVFAAGDDGLLKTADDIVTSAYRERRDSQNRITLSETLAEGVDAILGTEDDVVVRQSTTEYDANSNVTVSGFVSFDPASPFGSYSRFTYDANGNVLTTMEYRDPGDDGEYYTSDDIAESATIKGLDDMFIGLVANNIGNLPAACDVSAASGDIGVNIVDQFGAVVSDALVRLGNDGTMLSSDVTGHVNFTGVSGVQDVHIFKDGYSWESFYCITPGASVTLTSKLRQLDQPLYSTIALPNGIQRDVDNGGSVLVVLIGDQGKVLAANARVNRFEIGSDLLNLTQPSVYSQILGNQLYVFDTPVGASVTGELWAFRYGPSNQFQSRDIAIEAAIIANETNYTTVEENDFNNPLNVSTSFSGVAFTDLLDIYEQSADGIFRYNNGISIGRGFDSSDATRPLKEAQGLPSFMTLSDVLKFDDDVLSITALSNPLPVTVENRTAEIIRRPVIDGFTGTETERGSISLLAATQLSTSPWLVETEVKVSSSSSNFNFYWRGHIPTGQVSVALPEAPTQITEDGLAEQFLQINIVTESHNGQTYQEAANDLTRDVPRGENYERIAPNSGSSVNFRRF